MLLRLRYQNVMSHRVGESGIPMQDLEAATNRFASLMEETYQERKRGNHSFLDLPYQTSGAQEWETFASGIRQRFKNLVVVGMGGSTLGFEALWRGCSHPFASLKPRRPGSPRVFILDNIDPETVAGLFEVARPRDTFYVFISKSGTTPETVANFLICIEKLRKVRPETWPDHMSIVTDPDKGPLRTFASREGIPAFHVPPGVGGRFSVLSAVGMLPAAIAGIPITEVMAGAKEMDTTGMTRMPEDHLPFRLALIHHLLGERGKNISVMMPYADSMEGFSRWFRQLWAESLGKRLDSTGREVFAGQTPIAARGAVDQHSQLQLYAEGPNDKVIGFLTVEKRRKRARIGEADDLGPVSYLSKTPLEKLLKAEQEGTEVALTRAGRPNYTLTCREITPRIMGALFYVFETAVLYAGRMLGVNPYDQPGVEAAKLAAAALLGKEGMDQERKEIRTHLRAERKHTLEW